MRQELNQRCYGRSRNADRLGNCRQHQRRFAYGRQRDEYEAIEEISRILSHLERQTRLADTARTRQRKESYVLLAEQSEQHRNLVLTADERCKWSLECLRTTYPAGVCHHAAIIGSRASNGARMMAGG